MSAVAIPTGELITVAVAAAEFGCDKQTIWKYIRTGVLPAVNCNDMLRVSRDDLARLAEAQATGPIPNSRARIGLNVGDPAISGTELARRVPGLTYRMVDYWSSFGIFGPEKQDVRSGFSRRFTAEDERVARVLVSVRSAVARMRGDSGGVSREMLLRLSSCVRRGATQLMIGTDGHVYEDVPAGGVYLVVDVEAVLDEA